MDPIKTDAIVLRVVEFSETSCIVTLFTRTLGKISTIAKGARRKKSPFEAALDLIAICRIVFLHKSSQSLDILTEAKLQRRFRSSAKDLDRFYAGLYLIELLNLMTDDADPHEDLFDEAVSAIRLIDDFKRWTKAMGVGQVSVKHALIHFEIRLLDLLGHLPMLTHCVDCGRAKTTISKVHFGLNRGGIICKNCRPGKTNIVSLSPEGLGLMLKMTKKKLRLADNGVGVSVDSVDEPEKEKKEDLIDVANQPGYPEVRLLISKYITHLIGHPPRLHQYLGNLSN